eukprot:6940753-Alexandrium_andersonii.AAC.1
MSLQAKVGEKPAKDGAQAGTAMAPNRARATATGRPEGRTTRVCELRPQGPSAQGAPRASSRGRAHTALERTTSGLTPRYHRRPT